MSSNTVARITGTPSPAGVTATVLALGYLVELVAGFALLLTAGWPVASGTFAVSAALLVASLTVESCKRFTRGR
ncbi:hypothetical protein [Curtobacterium pusillum]|uniref:Uncharacterized protein n=1 Tax=Curtobacterium pusillum TaxID=69373 RepID=A0ABX2M4L7_9MICO|nr:hypothetical protein [Curtobacterium pusillum]NUU12865.1 hypothetical protein [Curtobacterium pusillum]